MGGATGGEVGDQARGGGVETEKTLQLTYLGRPDTGELGRKKEVT